MSQADAPTTAIDDVPAGRGDGERGLVERLRRGDDAAAHELVERYAPRAYRLALAMTRNAEDAAQIVQDALGRVVRDVDAFGGDGELGSWLDCAVTNAACRSVRRADRQWADTSLDDVLPRFHEDGAPATRVDDWSGRLDDPAIASRVRASLDAAIDQLGPDDRAVIILRDVEGLTLDEAATALGVSVATVKTRLHRARLFLRKCLGIAMTNP